MEARIAETFAHEKSVKVKVFTGLTARFAEEIGAAYIVRGLRNTTDFEYENTISQANHHLNPGLETIFLITSPEFSAINSTIVREIHKYGGDVRGFLPYLL
jgi:pantetheine-phosphate adenylyltransferase